MKTRDYYWQDSLVLKDGKIYLRSSYNQSDKPILTVLYWPVDETRGQLGRIDRTTLPLPAHRAESGLYTVRLEADLDKPVYGYDTHADVYLINGGQTQSAFVENLDIPQPKTRKGIETRFRNGSWEKYSKRDGWISA